MPPTTAAQKLLAKIAEQREQINALREYFALLFPAEFMVDDYQFGVWVRQYLRLEALSPDAPNHR